jgi:hypothetical protein
VSKPEPPSAFVKRCLDALAEYQRLRFLGASHETACRPMVDAMQPRREQVRDYKLDQSGDVQ